ncbi:MAG: sugar ABC transporter ATP-binding protein [Eubacteriales bacterium]
MEYPLLKLDNITKKIEDFTLSNIDIELNSGEVHMIMGENGSGKSLMMQIASGFIGADGGSIYYRGNLVKNTNGNSNLLDNTIYIRQDATMLKTLSIPENIYFQSIPYKSRFLKIIDYNQLKDRCKKLIDEFNLPFTVEHEVKSLGLAQRQIAEICRAYVSNADIIILDEPTAALTEYEQNILYEMINKIKERGSGIFYITHSLDEVFSVGDKISVIKNGALVGTKNLKECTRETIISMLSGIYHANRYPKLNVDIGNVIYSISNLHYSNKLVNINLSLRKGEIIGITGLAGSGRTLLANCIFGAADYDKGNVELNNKPVKITNPFDAIENGIALVPEDRLDESIFRYLDIFENVAFSSLRRFKGLLGIDNKFLEQVVSTYISKLNIPKESSSNILEYSGGNQQKAILAKWIMSRAKIFVLDEPTRGVDNASKIDIYNSIGDLASKGAGIIMISSDIEEILGICDKVCVLSNQTIVSCEPVENMTKEKIIQLSIAE